MTVPIAQIGPKSQMKIGRALEGVRDARDFVGDLLIGSGVAEDVAFTARLITSELVTNAIEHTGSESVTVRVYRAEDDLIMIEVDDESDARPEPRPVGPAASSGRGLAIIAESARCWGCVLREGKGKTVWAGLAAS